MIIILLILHYWIEELLQKFWNSIVKSKSKKVQQITFDQSFVEIFLSDNISDVEIERNKILFA